MLTKIILITAALTAIGCAQKKALNPNGTETNTPTDSTVDKAASVVLQATSLPTCDTTIQGKIFYLLDSSQFEYCDGTTYQVVDLKGPKGDSGASASSGYIVRHISSGSADITIMALGTTTDVNAITATFSTNTLTIANVANTAQLVGVTCTYGSGINTGTSMVLNYPEISGQTSLATTKFPFQSRFNAAGTIQVLTSWTVSNSTGTVTVTQTGLTANAAATFNWQF